VADQQEEGRVAKEGGEAGDPVTILKRRKLELARVDVVHNLERASVEAHREMLRRALAALDKELSRL